MASANIPFFTSTIARVAWPHLDQKRTVDFQNKPLAPEKQYYDATLLFPKAADDSLQPPYLGPGALVAKVWEAWCKLPGTNQTWRQGARWPIIDCDADAAWLTKHPFARGHWRISVSSDYRPRVVDGGNNEIALDMYGKFRDFKGGDYALASINCYSYDTGTGGVSFGLEGMKKYADGEAIGGGGQRSAEQMFGGPAPAAPALPGTPAPGGYAPPQPPQTGYAPAAPPPNYPPPQQQYAPQPPMSGQPVYGQQPAGAPPLAPAYAPPAGPAYGAPPAGAPAYPTTPAPSPAAPTHGAYPSSAPGYPPQGGPGMPPPPPLPPFGQR